MGNLLFDQYTLLHFAIGIVAYFWNIPLKTFLLIHTIFEILENSETGIKNINKFKFWPGGKFGSDSFINIVGDTIGALIGWILAYHIDKLGAKKGYYPKHI